MYNWNTDTSKWNKDSESYQIWEIEQMVNFGLNDRKLDVKKLRKYWKKLNLDPNRKKFLEFILWPERS
jgi:hypothetical protein